MAFGFVVERFGLFLQISGREEIKVFQRHISFFVGISFVLLAAFIAFYSILQYKRLLKTTHSSEIPTGYNTSIGMVVNGIVGVLGIALSLYLTRSFL